MQRKQKVWAVNKNRFFSRAERIRPKSLKAKRVGETLKCNVDLNMNKEAMVKITRIVL